MFDSIKSFIRDLYNSPEGPIPLHVPSFNGNEEKYVREAVLSGSTSASGEFIERFENALADYIEVERGKVVAVSSGTAALHLALHMVGVQSGEEVLTQALTFVSTGNSILYCGAKPIFIDVDIDTMGMSPDTLSKFLKEYAEKRVEGVFNKQTGNRIAACLPMHTLGFPLRVVEVAAICKEWGIPLVEDSAESVGSWVGSQHTGTFGQMGIFSFNGNKTITSGGGGAVVFQDSKDAQRARHLISTAKQKHPYEYFHNELGFNYVMPNLNAALGLAQLEHISEMLVQKRELGFVYQELFEQMGVRMRVEIPGTMANFWLITLEFKDRTHRTQFLDELNDAQITCRPIWTLLNKMPAFQDCISTDISNSQFLEDRIVNVPSSVKGLAIKM